MVRQALLLGSIVVVAVGATGTHRNGRIAFVTDQQVGKPGLVSVSPGGGTPRPLFAAVPDGRPVVSPDGGRLALVVGGLLEVVRTDGTRGVQIGEGGSPTWSPDGSRLAFVDAQTSEIEITPAGGGRVRDLGVSGSQPVWSPSGDWIAFFSGYSTLEQIHPDGTGRTLVATNAYPDASILPVAWSHDGSWLSFGAVPADTNVLELDVVRPDGSGRRSFGNATAPAWSPRADLLAFQSNDNGFEVAAPDGSIQLSSDTVYGTPVWSANGTAVAAGTPDLPGVWIVRPSTGTITHVSIGGIPVWSPDSTRVAAVRAATLRTVAVTGGRPRVLAEGANAPVLWLPNGRIAYVTQGRVRRVIEIAPDGGFARVLLHGPTRFDAGPWVDFTGLAWAPDGSALAYLYGSELHVTEADGSRSRLIARGVTDTPAWSPDGRLIAIAAHGLRLVAAAGGPARLLTRAGDTAPAWSPDGRRIAFLSGDYLYALYVVDRDGSHLRQLADGVSSAPSWSPDGKRIAFSTGEDYGPTTIETIHYDGSGLTGLASATADETGDVLSDPRWSPDGKTILYYDDEYFCGSKCDELHLMLMRPDGTGKRRIPGSIAAADWSPDGKELLGQTGDESLLTVDLRTGRHRYLGVPTGAWSWQPLTAKGSP